MWSGQSNSQSNEATKLCPNVIVFSHRTPVSSENWNLSTSVNLSTNKSINFQLRQQQYTLVEYFENIGKTVVVVNNVFLIVSGNKFDVRKCVSLNNVTSRPDAIQ